MAEDSEPPFIPDFQLLRPIGAGSYGEVWLARGVTGMFRAVKIVRRSRFATERPYLREFEGVTRFVRLASGQPSQLAVLHAGLVEDKGFFFYVMELADDVEQGREIDPTHYRPRTLADEIRAGGRDVPWCLDRMQAVAAGLATLHREALVHRDIKPGNIVFVGGVPKLADIGLVAEAEDGRTFVGTETYGAPEGPGRAPADVYSLSRVMYEVYTGRPASDWPQGLDEGGASERLESEWVAVLLKAGDFLPGRRYADAAALLEDLQLVRAGRSVRRLRLAEAAARRLKRGLLIAGAVGVVASAAAVVAIRVERQRADVANVARRQAEAERDALASRTVYAAELAQAQRALENDDYGAARRHLKQAIPTGGDETLRGFEWHLLWKKAQGNATRVLREEGPAVEQVAWHAQSRCWWVAFRDGSVEEWPLGASSPREVLHSIKLWFNNEDPNSKLRAAVLASGQIATRSEETWRLIGDPLRDDERLFPWVVGEKVFILNHSYPNQLRMIDLIGGTQTSHELPFAVGKEEYLHRDHFAISPDGQYIAVSLLDGYMTSATWRLVGVELTSNEKILDRLETRGVGRIFFGSGGAELVAPFPNENLIETYHFETGATTRYPIPYALAYGPIGNGRAYGFLDSRGGIGLSTTLDDRPHAVGRGLDASAPQYSVASETKSILGGDEKGRLLYWAGPIASGAWPKLDITLPAGMYPVFAANERADHVALCTPLDGLVEIRIPEGSLRRIRRGISQVIAYDQERIVYLTDTNRIESMHPDSEKPDWSIAVPVAEGTLVASAPDGAGFAILSGEGVLTVLRRDGTLVFSKPAHGPYVSALGVSRGLEWIATSGNDGMLRLWSGSDGRMLSERKARTDDLRGGYLQIVVGTSSDWFVARLDGANAPLEVIDARTLKVKATAQPIGGAPDALLITRQSQRLVTSSPGIGFQFYSLPELSPLLVVPRPHPPDRQTEVPVVSLVETPEGFWCLDHEGRSYHWP